MHSNSHPTAASRPAASASLAIRSSWYRGESSHNGGANSARKKAASPANGYGRPNLDRPRRGGCAAPAACQRVSSGPHHWMASMKLQPSSKARLAPVGSSRLLAQHPRGVDEPQVDRTEPGLLQPVRHRSLADRLSHHSVRQRSAPRTRRLSSQREGEADRRAHDPLTSVRAIASPWSRDASCDGPLQRGRRLEPVRPGCVLVFGHLCPLRNGRGLDLDVELHAPGAGPDAQRLDGAVLVAGERRLGPGELGPPAAPCHCRPRSRVGEVAEHRVGPALGVRSISTTPISGSSIGPTVPPRASASSWWPRHTPR